MKMLNLLALATLLSVGSSHASTCTSVKNVSATFNSQLTTVFALAKGTKLEAIFNETSKTASPITLFLPTNLAFGKLPTSVTEAVTKSSSLRESVLLDHGIEGRINFVKFLSTFDSLPYINSKLTEQDLLKAGFPQSLNKGNFFFGGAALRNGGTNLIAKTELNWGSADSAFRGQFRDGQATLLGVDYETCVGLVHVIDTVITRRDEH